MHNAPVNLFRDEMSVDLNVLGSVMMHWVFCIAMLIAAWLSQNILMGLTVDCGTSQLIEESLNPHSLFGTNSQCKCPVLRFCTASSNNCLLLASPSDKISPIFCKWVLQPNWHQCRLLPLFFKFSERTKVSSSDSVHHLQMFFIWTVHVLAHNADWMGNIRSGVWEVD